MKHNLSDHFVRLLGVLSKRTDEHDLNMTELLETVDICDYDRFTRIKAGYTVYLHEWIRLLTALADIESFVTVGEAGPRQRILKINYRKGAMPPCS